jgi:hypothetical protein
LGFLFATVFEAPVFLRACMMTSVVARTCTHRTQRRDARASPVCMQHAAIPRAAAPRPRRSKTTHYASVTVVKHDAARHVIPRCSGGLC